jgi:hypothetical protein
LRQQRSSYSLCKTEGAPEVPHLKQALLSREVPGVPTTAEAPTALVPLAPAEPALDEDRAASPTRVTLPPVTLPPVLAAAPPALDPEFLAAAHLG